LPYCPAWLSNLLLYCHAVLERIKNGDDDRDNYELLKTHQNAPPQKKKKINFNGKMGFLFLALREESLSVLACSALPPFSLQMVTIRIDRPTNYTPLPSKHLHGNYVADSNNDDN